MRGHFTALGMQTSYETVLRDSSTFLGIKWETMIADEAHRFKSVSGQTRNIITRMSVRWKLLLTGKPCCLHVHNKILRLAMQGLTWSPQQIMTLTHEHHYP